MSNAPIIEKNVSWLFEELLYQEMVQNIQQTYKRTFVAGVRIVDRIGIYWEKRTRKES